MSFVNQTKHLIDGWRFQKEYIESYEDCTKEAKTDVWEDVHIPHDYMILEPDAFHASSQAWYKRIIPIETMNYLYYLYFEGVYMEADIYINGTLLHSSKNGYNSFYVDISFAIHEGDNELLVHIINMQPNSRWYSGAGIYRDVHLLLQKPGHIVKDSIYISSQFEDESIVVDFSCELERPLEDFSIEFSIVDTHNGCIHNQRIYNSTTCQSRLQDIVLWDINNPYLYTVHVTVYKGDDDLTDIVEFPYGFRKTEFFPDKGFYLNDRKVDLRGICLHHDLGGLGAKHNRSAAIRRLEQMREMGVNAIRTTHNPYAPDFLKLCDEMGFLLIDEFTDIWKISKTQYDYARFFDDHIEADIARWIRRDRLHPSIIMWSIGNEIPDTHASPEGRETMNQLMDLVAKHDPRKHAVCTLGSNYMAWENTQRCAEDILYIGYNYAEKLYDAHHEAHPNWYIYGSETSSVVQSRGVYHFPAHTQILTDDDYQCSSLGNSTTTWGAKDIPTILKSASLYPYTMGQFIWTGTDYIGEPTPYQTKNSYFGQVDTAGFPKDSYYLFQATWVDPTERTVLHLYPHWDWNLGQTVDIFIASNAAKVELICNGTSLGIQNLQAEKGEVLAHWTHAYEPGYIEAIAYDEKNNRIASHRESSFTDPVEIQLSTEETLLQYLELRFIEISLIDAKGQEVKNANNEILVELSGPGQLVYLDNGDSTDYTPYQQNVRRAFNGKLLAVVEATGSGEISVTAKAKGLPDAKVQFSGLSIPSLVIQPAGQIIAQNTDSLAVPIRKIELVSDVFENRIVNTSEFCVEARIHPANATFSDLYWRVTNEYGVDANNVKIQVLNEDARKIRVQVLGDGKFYVRCSPKNGKDHYAFISSLDFLAEGLGSALRNPYEFFSAAQFDAHKGEIGSGNERGISLAHVEKSWICFQDLDFGDYASSNVEIPIFSLNDENCYWIWQGEPYAESSKILCEKKIIRKSIWNTYQVETFDLSERLTGIQTIAIEVESKAHIKSLQFHKENRAFDRLDKNLFQSIHGDSYTIEATGIAHIGNNVSINVGVLDFTSNGTNSVRITGKAHNRKNSIHLVFESEGERIVELIEFLEFSEVKSEVFSFARKTDEWKVTAMFLPGSDFDLYSIQFIKAND